MLYPQALDKVRELGDRGIQVYATHGEISPQGFSSEGVPDYRE